jgi:hypothetical protein
MIRRVVDGAGSVTVMTSDGGIIVSGRGKRFRFEAPPPEPVNRRERRLYVKAMAEYKARLQHALEVTGSIPEPSERDT